MQVNAPPSFFQGSYLFFSCQEHKITSMDCEGLSKEEIQAAAAELTYLQTSALKGAAFGATFSPPQVAAPLTPATDPFRSQPSTPFSNFSGTTLVPTPTHGPLQETPSKFQKPAPSPFKGQGKGMGAREAAPSTQEDQSQEQSNRAKRRQLKTRGQHGAPAQSSGASSSTDTLVQQMAALLLRHEDQFGVLAQSTAWVMFMGTAPPLSVVAPMAAVANQWHKDQRERPGSLKFPLRVLLLQSFLHSMGQALEKLTNDPAYKAEAIRLEILQEPDQLPFLRWNPEVRQVEVLASQMPLTVAEVAQMLQDLMVLSAAPGVITRFHSTRKLSEELAGPTITFVSSSEPVHLWSRPSWRRCLRRWPDTGRQQDAAEFLTFLQVPAQLRLFGSLLVPGLCWKLITCMTKVGSVLCFSARIRSVLPLSMACAPCRA